MQHLVPKQLLLEFMTSFIGYGNLSSPNWFIGKEEGGDTRLEENLQRILVWERMGKSLTVDTNDYHRALGFSEKELQKIQPTYTKLIQILLEIDGRNSISTEARRHFQRNFFGRSTSNHCAIELMPMASRSTGLWLWKDIFNAYFKIKNRKEYFDLIAPQRKQLLKKLIAQYQPKLVHFYSTQADYLPHWHEISGSSEFSTESLSAKFNFQWKKVNKTLFVITPHPTAHGLTVNDFPKIGQFIKKQLGVNS